MVESGGSEADVICPIGFGDPKVSRCLTNDTINAGDIFSCHFRSDYPCYERQNLPPSPTQPLLPQLQSLTDVNSYSVL
jgi:hypothetical protein